MYWLAFQLPVEQWIISGGYVVLFALLFLCGLGLPVPEDVPLLISGGLIASGKFHLAIAAPVAWCGIIGGDCVLYHLGKKFGLGITTRVPYVGKHVTKERIEKLEGLFSRWGVLVVGVGRMFAGVRGAMVVAAGAIRYNFLVFVIADGIGAILSGGLFQWLGWFLGNKLQSNMGKINKFKHEVGIGLGALVVVAIAFFIWRQRRKVAWQKMEAIAAAAVAQAEQQPAQQPVPVEKAPERSPVDASGPRA